MSAAEQPSRLMDNRRIREELGVSETVADKIIRWCADRSGTVKPHGIRKTYVYRADVDAWLAQSTRSIA